MRTLITINPLSQKTTKFYLLVAAILPTLMTLSCGDEGDSGPCWEPASTQLTNNLAKRQEAIPGSYIVAFRSETAQKNFASYDQEYRTHYGLLAARYLNDPRVKRLDFISAIDLAKPGHGDAEVEFDTPRSLQLAWSQAQVTSIPASLAEVQFKDEQTAKQVLWEWENDQRIWYAEPNQVSRLAVQDENTFQAHADFYEGMNYWWHKAINLTEGFSQIAARDQSDPNVLTDAELQSSLNRPIVAILDSGVDYLHPALQANMWTNTDINASRCTDDVHGCDTTQPEKGRLGVGDVHPYGTDSAGENCFDKDPNCSHGTHVAGIVAGDPQWVSPEVGTQTPGVCPTCQIMVLKIVSKVGAESGILDGAILRAFKYVALKRRGSADVRIINASFGKFVRSRSVGLLLRVLKERKSTLVIGAAGNEDSMTQEYPAAFSDAIAVSAVDEQLRKVSFSNFGRWVDIAAPGSNIVSTFPGEGSGAKSGTSMAAPLVSGVAGLILTRFPNIGHGELRSALLDSADATFYKETENDGYNYNCYYPKIQQVTERQPLLGTGIVQAEAALKQSTNPNIPIFTSLDRVKPGCGVIGESTGQGGFWWLLLAPLLVPFLWRQRFKADK